jgi:hypothetical protein
MGASGGGNDDGEWNAAVGDFGTGSVPNSLDLPGHLGSGLFRYAWDSPLGNWRGIRR